MLSWCFYTRSLGIVERREDTQETSIRFGNSWQSNVANDCSLKWRRPSFPDAVLLDLLIVYKEREDKARPSSLFKNKHSFYIQLGPSEWQAKPTTVSRVRQRQ